MGSLQLLPPVFRLCCLNYTQETLFDLAGYLKTCQLYWFSDLFLCLDLLDSGLKYFNRGYVHLCNCLQISKSFKSSMSFVSQL